VSYLFDRRFLRLSLHKIEFHHFFELFIFSV
jgi:hypothetical protein